MDKQLLVEWVPFSVNRNSIMESISRNGGRLIVSGVMQRANARNQNQRIYPKTILERELDRYVKNEVAERRALGELDHADSSTVNLKNVSHNILEIKWKGDDVIGTIEILPTPAGNILKSLFEANITLGISSRGVGSVKSINEGDDTMEVQNDFNLVTFDFVSTPSTHGAFMKPINMTNEGKLLEHTVLPSKTQKIDSLIHDIICELSGVCCIDKRN